MKLPFTSEQFFQIINDYNTTLFPAQIIIPLIGLIILGLLHSKNGFKDKTIGLFLGMVWLWIGFAYHLAFFTSINKAAYGFGVLFILQGIFFIIEVFRNKLQFQFNKSVKDYIGYFFILFGLIIYPVISFFLESSFSQTITLGLPCPTTIMTFGFLMLTGKKLSKYLIIIPIIWAIIGTGAATKFGVYHDYLMPLAAIITTIFLLKRKKE
ncbi:MAG: DUF6064 family protein [Prolixibacteraceae bacterium]|nr:DUF6064 family protein [Prolixibacteraceae bacterium]